ncbi:MAG: penicillin acylase family protein [Hyphomonas sp.]
MGARGPPHPGHPSRGRIPLGPAAVQSLRRRSGQPRGQGYDAEIIRDEFGVPHIRGARDRDAAFGLAYAHAEDDFGDHPGSRGRHPRQPRPLPRARTPRWTTWSPCSASGTRSPPATRQTCRKM